MISGKAKELFLKWYKEEKQLDFFEEKPTTTQIFALCEWLKIQGYAISTKSNYYNSDYTAKISFNQGDYTTASENSLEKAYFEAIKFSIDDFNDRFLEADA